MLSKISALINSSNDLIKFAGVDIDGLPFSLFKSIKVTFIIFLKNDYFFFKIIHKDSIKLLKKEPFDYEMNS